MSAQNDDKKRLKILMPEVLPDPRRAASVVAHGAAPRARTLATMHRLLALAAATGAMGATGAGCTKDDGTSPPIKRENDVAKNVTTAPTTPTTTASPPPTTPTTPPTTPPTPSTGYLVVDPMPRPAKCAGIAATIRGGATFKSGPGGALYIELHLVRSTRADVHFLKTSPPSTWGGAKIMATTFIGDDVVVTIIPDASSSYLTVELPADCSSGTEHLAVDMSWTGKAASGTPITVDVRDAW